MIVCWDVVLRGKRECRTTKGMNRPRGWPQRAVIRYFQKCIKELVHNDFNKKHGTVKTKVARWTCCRWASIFCVPLHSFHLCLSSPYKGSLVLSFTHSPTVIAQKLLGLVQTKSLCDGTSFRPEQPSPRRRDMSREEDNNKYGGSCK